MKFCWDLTFPNKIMYWAQFLILSLSLGVAKVSCTNSRCVPADFGEGSIVCVCNATYCDFQEPLEPLEKGSYVHIESTKSGNRFAVKYGLMQDSSTMKFGDVELFINRGKQFQTVFGFGGAFTDAAGINLKSLSKGLQEKVIESYFGDNGLQYNIGRVPMGSSDFSTHPYSYDESENDSLLTNFSLAMEDTEYKIPFIKKAQKHQGDALKLITTPWSAPKWMKTNNDFRGRGFLKTEYYQSWAEYFVKFFEEYSKHNVTFWGLTTQNEPLDGMIPNFPFNSLGWTPVSQRDWIRDHLGPTLRNNSAFQDIKIFILDDQRYLLLEWIPIIMRDRQASKYVDGVGLHWYGNKLFPVKVLDLVHKWFPNLMILGTEACTGSSLITRAIHATPVLLGSWQRGVAYALDIIENFNHYMAGWIDWNLVLDKKGGPNWAKNEVDAPIITDPELGVIYKQPMFYALGHFSKFIPRGSTIISSSFSWWSKSGLHTLAALRPDGNVVLVIVNTVKAARDVKVAEYTSLTKSHFSVRVAPYSINTIIY